MGDMKQKRVWFGTGEAAELLDVTERRVRYLLQSAVIVADKHGKEWMIPREEWDRLNRFTQALEKGNTINKLSKILRIRRKTVFELINKGKIKVVKIGRRVVYEDEELARIYREGIEDD